MEFNWVYIGMCFSCAVISFLPAQVITKFIGKKFFSGSFTEIRNWSFLQYVVHLAVWWVLFMFLWELVMKV